MRCKAIIVDDLGIKRRCKKEALIGNYCAVHYNKYLEEREED